MTKDNKMTEVEIQLWKRLFNIDKNLAICIKKIEDITKEINHTLNMGLKVSNELEEELGVSVQKLIEISCVKSNFSVRLIHLNSSFEFN